MINESICYPNPNFSPEIRIYDGVEFAHAGKTPFWCDREGHILQITNGIIKRPFINLQNQHRYKTRCSTGAPIGYRYPDVKDGLKHYRIHTLMALAWIGPIPRGWQVDHKNADIYNWMLDNIRIVSVHENYRCAVILRWLRAKGIDTRTLTGMQCMVAFAIVPVFDSPRRQSITKQELLILLSRYVVTDPNALMDYEMSHHCEC